MPVDNSIYMLYIITMNNKGEFSEFYKANPGFCLHMQVVNGVCQKCKKLVEPMKHVDGLSGEEEFKALATINKTTLK